jgi:hypothetical protein
MTWSEFVKAEPKAPTTWVVEVPKSTEEVEVVASDRKPARKFGRASKVRPTRKPESNKPPSSIDAIPPPPPPPATYGVTPEVNPALSLPSPLVKPSTQNRREAFAENTKGTLVKANQNLKAVVLDIKAGVKEIFGKDAEHDHEVAERHRQKALQKEMEHQRKSNFYDAKANLEEVHGH